MIHRGLLVGLSLAILAAWSTPSVAIDLAAGVGSLSGNDDRQQSSFSGLLRTESISLRLHYADRSFGPVSESTTLFALYDRLKFNTWKFLSTDFGFVVLQHQTRLSYSTPAAKNFNRTDKGWNVGMALSVLGTYRPSKLVFFALGWDAYLFPAGIAGGLFLATGRKQVISASVGFKI